MSTQIRMPDELHAQLVDMAKRQYRTLNSLIVSLLAEAAAKEQERERRQDADR